MFLLCACPVDPGTMITYHSLPPLPFTLFVEGSICISIHLFLVCSAPSVCENEDETSMELVSCKEMGRHQSYIITIATNATPLVAEDITQHLRTPVGPGIRVQPAVLCSRLHKAVVQVSARLGFFTKFWILFGVSGYWQKSVPWGHRTGSFVFSLAI